MTHLLTLLLIAIGAAGPVFAQELRGHGGPVRALSIFAEGRLALSGSFDTTAIIWSLETGSAIAVLRHHDGPVNAVAALGPGAFATGGEEGRIALWRLGRADPTRVIAAHQGPISSLVRSPDGRTLASGSWDGTVRLTDIDTGASRILGEHRAPVNAVAFSSDGALLLTGGHEGVVRWLDRDGRMLGQLSLGQPINALHVLADGQLIAAGADGVLRWISAQRIVREVGVSRTPIIALGVSPDGRMLAVAGIRGAVALLSSATGERRATLVGPGLPVWSLAFAPSGRELLTGGGDRLIRRWNAETGEHLGAVAMARPSDALASFGQDRGAQVYRACVACHTLHPDEGPRAGPTLYRVIGRRIGSADGYDFSAALRGMDIIWSKDTIARLFEIGPNAYTPGTKMPEQIVGDPEDREALVEFIARATAPRR